MQIKIGFIFNYCTDIVIMTKNLLGNGWFIKVANFN